MPRNSSFSYASSSNNNNNNHQNASNLMNIDHSLDPYYVHHSDTPTSVTVTPVLAQSGRNYHSWARKMRRALGLKNKFHFVDGTIQVPDESDLTFLGWEKCNNLVHSWLVNSMAPELAESVVFIENAIDVWNELKEQFMRGDRIRVSRLQQEIANIKQGNRSIPEYYTELRTLWEELEQYRPMPKCNCPVACTCQAMRNARAFRLEDRIIQFLVGLNEEYQAVSSQILLMEPLPLMNRVFSMVLEQERHKEPAANITGTEETNGMINVVTGGRGRGNGNFQGRGGQGRCRGNGRQCTYCGKTGHTIEICFKKHGYPPNFGRGSNAFTNNVGIDDTDNRSILGKADEED